MSELNKRQRRILDYIEENQVVGRKDVEAYIANFAETVSKVTIIRDLDVLLHAGLIGKTGSARNVTYRSLNNNPVLKRFDAVQYFAQDADSRSIKYPQFNFEIFSMLHNLFSDEEINALENINSIYRKKINNLSDSLLKKEYERLLIELSWKSSQIEGNTYSLLDTEVLIKDNIEAEGHKKDEAVMILNHKKALEYIFDNREYFCELTIAKIEELHSILTADMSIDRGLRQAPVGIVGTNYKPLFNRHQIREAMEKLVELINKTQNILEKALITVLMISYIQPFADGNKRTGRILANAILFANGYCPLSYRSVKDVEYKKAVIIFYENNSLVYFKQIFTEQFKFAVDKYF